MPRGRRPHHHVNLAPAERESKGSALVQAAVAARQCFASESAERIAGNEMALDVERVLDRNHCADPGDLNRCIFRSRRRTGRCEFSARLFLRRPCSWRAVNLSSDFAAAYERSWSVTRTSGATPCFFEQLAHQFHGCSLVASPLDQQIENLAFVFDRPPQPKLAARDHYGHLIEMPCMDAPARARWFRIVWSRDRVRSCIRPLSAACHDRWPV
jgi:hypothetical protein